MQRKQSKDSTRSYNAPPAEESSETGVSFAPRSPIAEQQFQYLADLAERNKQTLDASLGAVLQELKTVRLQMESFSTCEFKVMEMSMKVDTLLSTLGGKETPCVSAEAMGSVTKFDQDGFISRKEEPLERTVADYITMVMESCPVQLNGVQVIDMSTFFSALCDDAGGVEKEQLLDALVALGMPVKAEDVEQFFEHNDIRGDNALSFDEFTTALTPEQDRVSRTQSKMNDLRVSLQNSEPIIKTFSQRLRDMDKHRVDNLVDFVMVGIILLNSFTIGVSMDYDWDWFVYIDVGFSMTFLVELMIKFRLHGCRPFFNSVLNSFDFCLICVDIFQLILFVILKSPLADAAPPASMFRVVRLVRLGRLARLVKLQVFADLISMIGGMIGGMTTLLWSILLFVMIVYITSLLFREFFGHGVHMVEEINITTYFDSVPRSMLTVFLYFFGEFQTMDGISLWWAILQAHGTVPACLVCCLFFVITIGVFNVIAAIFVESTMDAANGLQNERKSDRLNDTFLWSSNISFLLRKLFDYHGMVVHGDLAENLNTLGKELIPESEFAAFIGDSEVVKALDNLEISRADHKTMFDILDNDNTGDIYMYQFVDGLRRLRGDPRRSDIISVDLMVRSIQEQTDALMESMKEQNQVRATLVGGQKTILDHLALIHKAVMMRPDAEALIELHKEAEAAADAKGDVAPLEETRWSTV